MIPIDYLDILVQGNEQQVLDLLPVLERFAVPEKMSAVALLPLLQHESFAVRVRTFIALGRIADVVVLPELLTYMKKERETHWRLLALDAISFLPGDKSAELGAFIYDENTVFLRGLLRVLADQGENSLPFLLDFLALDNHRYMKDDLLTECFFVACGEDEAVLRRAAEQNKIFARWYRYRIPWDGKIRYKIYPYPDYLWKKAEAAGLSQKTFKSLYWWHRNKTNK